MPAPYVVLGGGSSGGGTTRKVLRRLIADELGELAVLTVSATPSSAVTPDADRQVLVTALGSDGVDVSRFDGGFIYVVNGAQAGETRAVLSGTFDGAISSLLLDRPFSAPLASGTEIELTKPLPGGRHLTTKGVNDILTEALERIHIEVRLALTGNGTYQQDLSPYPWITRYEQLRGISDTALANSGGATVPMPSPYGYRMVSNGATRTLVTQRSYAAGETFYLDAIAPASVLVYDGTGWGYAATPGLLNDSYQTAAPVRWVVAFAMVKALQALSRNLMLDRRMDPDERKMHLSDILMRRDTWGRAAARIKMYEFPKPLPEPSKPMTYTPSQGGWQ